MQRFAICNISGSIQHIYNGPQSLSQKQCSANQVAKLIPDNLDDSTAYLETSTNTIKAKTTFPITIDKTSITADGVDAATISGIPSGTSLTWPDGQTDTITDGTAIFSVDLAGTYKLILRGVPYLTKEITIEAVA